MCKEKIPEELYKKAEAFLGKGIKLEAEIMEESFRIREQAKQAYKTEWLDARLQLISIIRHLQEFKSGVPGKTNTAISERFL